jgi:ATP-dependent Lon protease
MSDTPLLSAAAAAHEDEPGLLVRIILWLGFRCPCSRGTDANGLTYGVAMDMRSKQDNLTRIETNLARTEKEIASLEKEFNDAKTNLLTASKKKAPMQKQAALADAVRHSNLLLERKRKTAFALTNAQMKYRLYINSVIDQARHDELMDDIGKIRDQIETNDAKAEELREDLAALTQDLMTEEQKEEVKDDAQRIMQAMELIKISDPTEPFIANRLDVLSESVPNSWIAALPAVPIEVPALSVDDHQSDNDESGGGGVTLRSKRKVALVDQL